jgi:DNA helicase-2/ATP-dependent DNA helicase PcrA
MVKERIGCELEEIIRCIDNGNNFLLSGGAGSGKTYSLVQVLKQIESNYPSEKITCITYTNAAAIEIKNRAKMKNLSVSTIHDFLWGTISSFQKEMKQTLIELINDSECKNVVNPNGEEIFHSDFEDGIRYSEYVKMDSGIISHDEVIELAYAMYKKYPRLCDLLIDSSRFILVDEYQDTSPLVVKILLDFLSVRKKSEEHIVGFFGDSMQSIYEHSVGDIEEYISEGKVVKVEIKQNRRNPETVINLANKLRTDGLEQEPSEDSTAPNMEGGVVKKGSIKFLYSVDFNLEKAKNSAWCNGWNFSDSKKTKELRLTHNLIASEAGYAQLMAIYDADPLVNFKAKFRKEAKSQEYTFNEEDTFESVVNSMKWAYKSGKNKGKSYVDVFLEDDLNKKVYNYVKSWSYQKVRKIYFDKDCLIDDKVVIDGVVVREPKRDRLIQHLFKIQDIVSLYRGCNYNELIRKVSFQINSIADKKKLKDAIERIDELESTTIENAIDIANTLGLCIKDDKLLKFIEDNEYIYWRVKDIPFDEFQNLYKYLEGYTPFSTQHKIKGLEFENVLIVLNNGGWSSYNFDYLFSEGNLSSLSAAKQESYHRILPRTKKLFYVCCTRAKDNLVVFYPNPTADVLAGAKTLFGEENCMNLDEN